jgi:hypothetical protein
MRPRKQLLLRLESMRPQVRQALLLLCRDAPNTAARFVHFEIGRDLWSETAFPVTAWIYDDTPDLVEGLSHGSFLLAGADEPAPLFAHDDAEQDIEAIADTLTERAARMLREVWKDVCHGHDLRAFASSSADGERWTDLSTGRRTRALVLNVAIRAAEPPDDAVATEYVQRLRVALADLDAALRRQLDSLRPAMGRLQPTRVLFEVFGDGVYEGEPATAFFFDREGHEMPDATQSIDLEPGLESALYLDLVEREPNLDVYGIAASAFIAALKAYFRDHPIERIRLEARDHRKGSVVSIQEPH